MAVPRFDDLLNPLLRAIGDLGGSASIAEQEDAVASLLKLSEKDVAEIHRGTRTKLSYRLAWARNYLKRSGHIENSERGVWSLTALGRATKAVDKKEITRLGRTPAHRVDDQQVLFEENPNSQLKEDDVTWQDAVLDIVKSMHPSAFERLCQRLLRESGFIQVEVTGKSGDEGIDGKGVVRLAGLLSFHVHFQCKRYKGSVSAGAVRDFRGAMVGRADKGLIVTTGTFTRDARHEAQRDGAPPIDLIDGYELAEKLKQLRIGVTVRERRIEEIDIDKAFFEGI